MVSVMMLSNRGERSTWRKTDKSGEKLSKRGIEIDRTERERQRERQREKKTERERSVHNGKSGERFRRCVTAGKSYLKDQTAHQELQSGQNLQLALTLGFQGQDRSLSERQMQVRINTDK